MKTSEYVIILVWIALATIILSKIDNTLTDLNTNIIKIHDTLGVLTCKELNDTRQAFEECLSDDEFTNTLK